MSSNTLVILLSMVLVSCDPFYETDIINKTDKEVTVVFEYDKAISKSNVERNISFRPSIAYYNENPRTEFEIDSINYIVFATLQPTDTLPVEWGIGTRPDFNEINKILIYKGDTISIETRDEMLSSFVKNKEGGFYHYNLLIE
jgi:hypothetical protein